MLKETQQRLNEASSELHNISMYVHVLLSEKSSAKY